MENRDVFMLDVCDRYCSRPAVLWYVDDKKTDSGTLKTLTGGGQCRKLTSGVIRARFLGLSVGQAAVI